jgi:hypothetical protein
MMLQPGAARRCGFLSASPLVGDRRWLLVLFAKRPFGQVESITIGGLISDAAALIITAKTSTLRRIDDLIFNL